MSFTPQQVIDIQSRQLNSAKECRALPRMTDEINELRAWCEMHTMIGNRQARLTLNLIEAYEALQER